MLCDDELTKLGSDTLSVEEVAAVGLWTGALALFPCFCNIAVYNRREFGLYCDLYFRFRLAVRTCSSV